MKNNKGITLIALVVTIVVLLILAGVSISMLTGENGIITQAKRAKEETEKATEKEKEDLKEVEDWLENKKPDDDNSILVNMEFSGEKEQVTTNPQLKVKITQESFNDQIDIEKCKWTFNTNPDEIGTDEKKYENQFTSKEEEILLTMQSEGTYYLHILSKTKGGILKENISSPIELTQEKHFHTGDTSAGGGCYTKPKYHSHTSTCNSKCHVWASGCQGGGSTQDDKILCPVHEHHYSCGRGDVQVIYKHQKSEPHKGQYSYDHDYISCGKSTSTIESYELNCGYEDEQVTKSIIKY